MKILFAVWRKMEEWIFTNQFRRKYRTPVAKSIFVLYCCVGGFCFDCNVRNRFRKFWIIFNILNFLLVNGSCIFYLIHAPITTYHAFLFVAPTICGIFTKTLLYFWTFFTRDEFVKLFDFLYNKPPPLMEKNEQKYNSFCNAYLTRFEGRIIAGICFFLFFVVEALDFEIWIRVEGYFTYLYPIYMPFDRNFPLRIAIRFIQCVSMMPEIISGIAFPTLLFVIVTRIYYKFELLGLFIRNAAYSLVRCIDEITNLEIAMEEGRVSSSSMKIRELKIKKALALEEFVGKIVLVIKRHQQLYSITKLFTKKLNYVYCVLHSEMFVVEVIGAFLVSLKLLTSDYFQTSLLIVALIGILFFWIIYCYIGEELKNMNKIIYSEIYDSPWYLLEPKDRKLIFIFLTMIEQPIKIFSFWIYPVDLSLVPYSVNTIYSKMQILHNLQIKK